MRTAFCGILAAMLLYLLPETRRAQQPVPVDPNPLERPSSMTVAKARDATALFATVAKVIGDNAFAIVSQDIREGTIVATKADQDSANNFDKVIVWLERDFQAPSEFVNIYFLYGRFEKVFGHSEPVRIKVSAQDEQLRVGKLKQALLTLGQ